MNTRIGRAVDEVVGRVVLILVVHVEVAVLDGGPERRTAPEVVGVDVRAVLDEQAGDVEVVVEHRHQQRPDAVRLGQLDVRAGRDQFSRRLDPSVARGVQQRRHAALRFGAPPAIRQAAAVDADAFGAAARALARLHERRQPALSVSARRPPRAGR